MHQNSLKNGKLFLILLNDGWMVDLAMGSFGFLTIFLIFWYPWDPWKWILSVCSKWNLKQIEAIPPSLLLLKAVTKYLEPNFCCYAHFCTSFFLDIGSWVVQLKILSINFTVCNNIQTKIKSYKIPSSKYSCSIGHIL